MFERGSESDISAKNIAAGGILGMYYIPVCTSYNAIVSISDALKSLLLAASHARLSY